MSHVVGPDPRRRRRADARPGPAAPPRLRPGWLAAALCLGALLTLGSTGTRAFWRDQATIEGEAFTSGTLDVLLDGALAGQAGTWTNPQLGVSDLRPGDSLADQFEVRNGGSVPLDYRATAVATGSLAPHLRFSVATGATAVNQVTAQGGRVGACQGGARQFGEGTLGADPTVVIGDDQRLDPGRAQVVCVTVRLDPAAPPQAQAQSASARFGFDARQPGAPR